LGDTNYRGREEFYEDPDDYSDNGVTAHGVRPDGATTAHAGADERNAGDNAGERKEEARRSGAEQTGGKT